MEKEEMNKGMKIRIEGNSVKFITPTGEVYFKKFSSFMQSIKEGKNNFYAPLSIEQKAKTEQVTAVNAATLEVLDNGQIVEFISAERV